MLRILQEYLTSRKGTDEFLFCNQFGKQFTKNGLKSIMIKYIIVGELKRPLFTYSAIPLQRSGFYQVKTFRVDKEGRATQVNFLEGIVW